jgi:hypothetical protein
MKKLTLLLCVVFVVMAAFIRTEPSKSGIHGTIEPADGAKKAWAVSGTDSVSTVPVAGHFSLELKPGPWTVIIEGNPPYKNQVMQNVIVQENQSTDVGIIKLSQ